MLPSMSHCSWPLSTYIYVSSTHGSNKTNKVELYSIQIPCCSDHFIALYNKDVNMGFLSTTGQISHHTETFIFSKDEKQTYLRASIYPCQGPTDIPFSCHWQQNQGCRLRISIDTCSLSTEDKGLCTTNLSGKLSIHLDPLQ